MALIKDIYSPVFYDGFADTMSQQIPGFDKADFTSQIYSDGFEQMEWKARMKHTTRILHNFLSDDFPEAARQIEKIIGGLRERGSQGGDLAYIFLADYIETYGLEDLPTAVSALEFVTRFISCEFAVRPFILRYETEMLAEMLRWSKHESAQVRRLASEGSRPRLPWAMAIPSLKKDPSGILPILENLKEDPSESVRRSVANSLNDIAKDHPEIVLGVAARWKGKSKETDAVVKHGCRTLLKQGHPEALSLYGLDSANLELFDFEIVTPLVKIGEHLEFVLTVVNNNVQEHPVRLEYGLYYQKANGSLARKVFKISERIFQPEEKSDIRRRQSFKRITTRRFHPGAHRLSIIINGEEKGFRDFELVSEN